MVKKKLFFPPIPLKTDCITVESGRRLVMEGVEEILYCDDERVELRGKFRLRVEGKRLQLVELGNGNLEINGRLLALFFEGWEA